MSAKQPEGTVADLAPGYTLYARNGAFAETIDVMKSVEDVGGIQRTLIYAKGLYGGQDGSPGFPSRPFRSLSREQVGVPGNCRGRSRDLRLEPSSSQLRASTDRRKKPLY
ncbi:MAG: hypothetical protein R2848_04680 [Thermomicrobiales bacterium]